MLVPTASSHIRLKTTPLKEDAAKLSDRVAIELGRQIVFGELAAGARLPTEAELCSLFGVSRSVIRDAVRTLAARGLVEVRQGHGMQVSWPSDAPFSEALIILLMRSDLTVGDVREARAAIEIELAPLAAERGQEGDWNRMEDHLNAYAQAVKQEDWPAAQQAHLSFHFSLLEATHLPALRILLKPMQQIILLASVPPEMEDATMSEIWTNADVRIHRPILKALRERDGDAAKDAMRSHFAQVFRRRDAAADQLPTLKYRESRMAQALLTDLLTARPQATGNAIETRNPLD